MFKIITVSIFILIRLTLATDSYAILQSSATEKAKLKPDENVNLDIDFATEQILNSIVNRSDSSEYYLEKGNNTLLAHLDSIEVVKRLNLTAIELMQSGDFLSSMYLLRWTTEIYPNVLTDISINNIAHNYQVLDLYDLAIESYKKSINLGEERHSYSALISLSGIFMDKGQYDSARKYIDQSQLVYTKYPEEFPLPPDQLLIKKARFLVLTGSYESALEELKKMQAESVVMKWGSYYLQFIALDSMNNTSEQERVMNAALRLNVNYEKTPLRHLMMINWWQYLFYNKLKKHEKAKIAAVQYILKYKQMVNQEIVASLLEEDLNNRILFEKNRSQYQNEVLNQEVLRNKQQSYFLLVIAILLVLVAVLIYSRYLKRKKLSVVLEKQVQLRTQELTEKNMQLADYAFINAHKLRAPVARLLGLTNLAVYTDDNRELKDYFDLIKKESADLDKVVHTISEAIGESSDLDKVGLN